MKICVVGAGAVGGLAAAYLARAGHDVAVVARGAHLAAIQDKGLTLASGQARFTVKCRAAEDPQAFGPQDAVILGLKAHGIGPMLPRLKPLLGPETPVAPAVNGIPWWYFHKAGGRFDGAAVNCVDPGGAMMKALDPKRLIGCIVYVAAEVSAPGEVRQTTAEASFALGELDDRPSPRVSALARAMDQAGLKTEVSPNIRGAVWNKLIGNVSFNPVAALALQRVDQIFARADLLAVVRAVLAEAMAVGRAYGVAFPMTVEQRLEVARRLGTGRPSMLQDVEQGRPMEVEAIVGAVVELARKAGVATPVTDTLYALIAACDAALAR